MDRERYKQTDRQIDSSLLFYAQTVCCVQFKEMNCTLSKRSCEQDNLNDLIIQQYCCCKCAQFAKLNSS